MTSTQPLLLRVVQHAVVRSPSGQTNRPAPRVGEAECASEQRRFVVPHCTIAVAAASSRLRLSRVCRYGHEEARVHCAVLECLDISAGVKATPPAVTPASLDAPYAPRGRILQQHESRGKAISRASPQSGTATAREEYTMQLEVVNDAPFGEYATSTNVGRRSYAS